MLRKYLLRWGQRLVDLQPKVGAAARAWAVLRPGERWLGGGWAAPARALASEDSIPMSSTCSHAGRSVSSIGAARCGAARRGGGRLDRPAPRLLPGTAARTLARPRRLPSDARCT